MTVSKKLNFLEILVPLAPGPSVPHTQAGKRGQGATDARGTGGPVKVSNVHSCKLTLRPQPRGAQRSYPRKRLPRDRDRDRVRKLGQSWYFSPDPICSGS